VYPNYYATDQRIINDDKERKEKQILEKKINLVRNLKVEGYW